MKTKKEINKTVREMIKKYPHKEDLIKVLTGYVVQVMGGAYKEGKEEVCVAEVLNAKKNIVKEMKKRLSDGQMGTSDAYAYILHSLNNLESDYSQSLDEHIKGKERKSKTASKRIKEVRSEWGRLNKSK